MRDHIQTARLFVMSYRIEQDRQSHTSLILTGETIPFNNHLWRTLAQRIHSLNRDEGASPI